MNFSRRNALKFLFGALPVSLFFWRFGIETNSPAGASDFVIVDGWILHRDDVKALSDAA